jgi:hypothetical protein
MKAGKVSEISALEHIVKGLTVLLRTNWPNKERTANAPRDLSGLHGAQLTRVELTKSMT